MRTLWLRRSTSPSRASAPLSVAAPNISSTLFGCWCTRLDKMTQNTSAVSFTDRVVDTQFLLAHPPQLLYKTSYTEYIQQPPCSVDETEQGGGPGTPPSFLGNYRVCLWGSPFCYSSSSSSSSSRSQRRGRYVCDRMLESSWPGIASCSGFFHRLQEFVKVDHSEHNMQGKCSRRDCHACSRVLETS